MKNKIFFVIIMMLGLILILSLSGCATVKPEEIVGKYHAQNQEDAEGVWLEIKGDNTWVDSTGASGTYKIVQEEIIFESGDEVKFSGTFVDGVLTLLKDGEIFGVWEKEIVSNPGTALKFEQVYAYAQEAGYTGTLEQLIEAFKGDSAYQLAVLQGYKGSEKDWLESLKGVAGKDGKTPTIGINGNWWIGDLDMGISATGKDGNGILKIEKDENNMSGESSDSDCYIIYFTNGTTTEFYIKKGQQGQKGNGIESVEKTGSEGLIDIYTITFTDGTTTTFTVTNGKSAYDLAVENGYRGTVEEWLASLVGEAGATGKSAYELAVENGYEGSEEQWLNSLVGSTGETGAEGKSAYDLAVENGYEGTLTEWLATLVGTPGATGATGVGIRSIEKTGSEGLVDTYTITFTDGTTTTFTVTNAPSNLPVTVVFDARGGVIENSYTYLELTLQEGEDDIYQGVLNAYNPIEILPIPVRQGLQFCGWYTGTTINDGQWLNNNTVSGDLTLYARWTTHPFVHVERTEPTCTEDGNIEYRYCPDCDLYFADAACTVIIEEEDTVLAALGHDYVTGVINPTCTEQGCTVHTCSRCEDRYCDNQTEALGHDMTLFEEKAPTCTEDGYKAHAYCARCEEYFADGTGARPIEYDSIVLTAIGHNYRAEVVAPTCSQKGYTEYTCENCGDVYRDHYTDRLAHEFEDGQCIHCHTPQYSEGLEFTLVDNIYYSVTDVGTAKENIVIPAEYEGLPVRAIGDYAFRYCADIKTVTIPSSVTSIGGGAFRGCSNLMSVTFGENSQLTRIGSSAFWYCSSLTSIEIPASVTSIGHSAFWGCSSLTSIEISSGVTSIGHSAFWGCSSLTSIEISSGVTSIGHSAFEGCSSLTSIEIPSSVTSIGPYAFAYCSSLTSVTFGENSQLTSIGNYAFDGCSSLTSIEIPSGVRRIGEYTFYNCSSLTSIEIPASVTSIGEYTFYNCSSLTSVTFGENSQLTSIGYRALYFCRSLTSIEIPSSVTSIGDQAFEYCSSLTIYCEAASKPSGWASDWNSGCPVVWDCNNNDVADDGYIYTVVDGIRYALKDGEATVTHQAEALAGEITILNSVSYKGTMYPVTSIESYAFSFISWSRLTSIVIPSSVTSIGEYAFQRCSSLTSIEIPSGVTSIGYRAFYNCSRLTIHCEAISKPSGWNSDWNYSRCPVVWDCNNNDVAIGDTVIDGIRYALKDGEATVVGNAATLVGEIAIPASITYNDTVYPVTLIGSSAFRGCSNLMSVTFGENSQLTSIGSSAFYYCSSLTSMEIPSSVTSVGDWAFYNCSSLTSVTFGENSQLTSIGSSAFNGCSSLTSIEIPDSVTSIGNSAFSGCSSLTSVTFGENSQLTSIGGGAFADCSGLTGIEIPRGVTSIGGGAFADCSGLTSIEIPSGVTSIGDRAFYNCTSLTVVTIPDSVTSIGDNAFWYCSSLTRIEIPSGVTSIGSSAFSGCRSLTSVTFGENSQLTSIGYHAFSHCRGLKSIEIPSSVTSIGDAAFNDCNSKIVYLSDIAAWAQIAFDEDGFSGSNPASHGVFYLNGEPVLDLVVPGTAGRIADFAFYQASRLRSVRLEEGVNVIGQSAFFEAERLKVVYIPKSVTEISARAFGGCGDLETIYFAGTEKDWAGIVKASDWDVNTGDYEIIFASELNEYAVSGEIFAADATENYADNEVVGGASVIVTGEDGVAYTTTADDRGRFSLSAIREGAYTLTISKEGYLPVRKEILVDSNLYLTIVMDFDATNTLSGKVTIADADTDFSNNLPLEGADVSIERTSSSNPLTAMVQTGADGMYRIEGLTIGRYTITVSKEGYKTVKQLFTVAVNQVNIQNIVLEEIPSSNVNDGYAAGKIIDSVTGAGVRGLQLYLYKGVNITSGTLISRSVTEENGRYRTEALEPGNYTIKIVDERELSDENLRYQDGILVIKVLSDQVIDNQNGYVTNNASLATDSLRIVLTWGATPRDLDSHLDIDLADGTSGHTWYSDKNYTKNGDLMADLDLDDTTSYGPETTTVYEMEQGVYTFYVHDYTNLNSNNSTALATSGAKVEVYLGNSVTAAYVFYVPDRAGTLWEVFSYNSMTGILTPKNNVTYHSSPSGIGR